MLNYSLRGMWNVASKWRYIEMYIWYVHVHIKVMGKEQEELKQCVLRV